ncbi:efflux RND transporter periplasmic adaptor subunit [Montanilutibacter psychrotolerans]|nr:efflux RND transporter periplasmic adaptor subunit [Lysobacter psychrotolerans]
MRFPPMTLNPIPLLAQAAALALLLTACSGEVTAPEARAAAHGKDEHAEEPHGQGAAPEAGHADAEEAAPTVTMDDDALKAAGIRIAVLVATSPGEQLRAPGEVLDSAYGTTLITPRVAALVVRRHARLGDEVRAGAPLATLASVDVSDAQAELRIAEQEWRRVSALGREAVAGRRISEARIAVDRARAKARAYGLPDTGHGSVDGRFTLPAPHAGRITEDDFVVGERIEPGRALYRLVDESVVWVDARLPSGTVPRLTAGSAATIVADGRRIPGTVLRAAHRTSEATRNAVVRIEVANEDDRLHGGDFVDVYLGAGGDAATPRLAVPSTALVQLQGDTVLFRRDAHGAIAPVPVRTGAVIGEQTVVEEGVNAGDAVVVEGAFAIKARLLKAQLGEGHAH